MLSQGLILYSNTHELFFNETSKTSSILSSYSNRISSVSLQRLLSRFLSANRLAVSLSVFRKQYFSECSPYRLNIGRSIRFFITIRERKQQARSKHTEDLITELKKWIEGPFSFTYKVLEKHVRQHLETGYKELWNLYEGKDGIRTVDFQCTALREDVYRKIKTEIQKQVSQNSLSFEIEKLNWFIWDIIDFIEGNILCTFIVVPHRAGTFSISSVEPNGSTSRSDYLRGDNEDDLKKLAEIMNNMLNDTQVQSMVKVLHEKKELLHRMCEIFVKKINLVIENVTHGVSDKDRVLLGKCGRC